MQRHRARSLPIALTSVGRAGFFIHQSLVNRPRARTFVLWHGRSHGSRSWRAPDSVFGLGLLLRDDIARGSPRMFVRPFGSSRINIVADILAFRGVLDLERWQSSSRTLDGSLRLG